MAAVTMMVAALLLAPSGAQAHAGHAHAVSSETADYRVSKPSHDMAARDATRTDDATVAAFYIDAKNDISGNTAAVPCTGGCCNPGSGCCAACIMHGPALGEPPIARKQPLRADLGGAGIGPAALPEPPRYLN